MRTMTRGALQHGKTWTYRNYGCRCDVCKAGHWEAMKVERAKRHARLVADPTVAPHGVYNTYRNWACRCPECREAARVQSSDRRRPRDNIDPAYARRRKIKPFGREWLNA